MARDAGDQRTSGESGRYKRKGVMRGGKGSRTQSEANDNVKKPDEMPMMAQLNT